MAEKHERNVMSITNFVWDQLSENVMFETNGNGSTGVSYQCLPAVYGEVTSQRRGASNSYFLRDGESSNRQLTNDNQIETDSYVYSAYGVNTHTAGSTTNPYRYKGSAGYYSDDEGNTVYVRARSYNVQHGRWMSKDPLGFVDGVNLYRPGFVPFGIDPSGNWPGYGKYCGPRSGPGKPRDGVDACCQKHDNCLPLKKALIPGRVAYCDARLALCLVTAKCNKSITPWKCRIARQVIANWMANPLLGTTPLTGTIN